MLLILFHQVLAACIIVPVAAKGAVLGVKGGTSIVRAAEGLETAEKAIASAQKGGETLAQIGPGKALDAASKGVDAAAAAFGQSARSARLGIQGQKALLKSAKQIAQRIASSPEAEEEAMKVITAFVEENPRIAAQLTDVALEKLVQLTVKFPILRVLDSAALQRVLMTGGKFNNYMGKLMEELFKMWVKNAMKASGGPLRYIFHIQRELGLEYVAGDLIRDAANVEISDGMFIVREGGKATIHAIVEIKGGLSGARELGGVLVKTLRDALKRWSPSARKALKLATNERWEEILKDAADRGVEVTTSKAKVQEEVFRAMQAGKGQIERSALRLKDGATLFINGEPVVVVLAKDVQWFGIIPQGMSAAAYQATKALLATKGFPFFVMTLPGVTKAELDLAATGIWELVQSIGPL